jgi:hydroxymethylpyrimidine pyrophosphatase-like HAD family hydrolase
MLVFDLDGVVTDPTNLNYDVDEDIIEVVAKDLRQSIPVAFNTGRTVSWVEAQVLPLLTSVSPRALSLLAIVGEKGGVVAEFDGQAWHSSIDDKLSLPNGFRAEALKILDRDREGHALKEYMFWDEGKLTMGSFEKHPSVPLEDFRSHQRELTTDLEILMQSFSMSDFKLDVGLIATDVEHISAGKHKGAEQIAAWLSRHQITPKSYLTFGDSPTDALMAAAFSSNGTPTSFVYVGDRRKYTPPADAAYKSIIMEGKYAKDTLAYLRSMKNNQ